MKNVIQFCVLILSVSFFVIIYSCSGAKTEIIGQWQDDNYQKGNIDKVLILGITSKDKPLLRRKFETGIAKAFIDAGLSATPSLNHIPSDQTIDSTTFEIYFKDLNVDAVIVSRLVGINESRDYKSGYLYSVPFNNYYGFYGYYYAGIQYANSSGYLSKNVVVVLETNIYDTKDEKLIWSGISETVDPDKASDVINSFGKELVSKLKREGYLK